jgi:purine-binding chemotaxis protein CheW
MSAQDRIAHLQEEIARRADQLEEAHGEVEAVLVFLLAGERYAFPLTAVREISRVRPITPLPGLPPSVLGAAGLRGEVVPVLDLRRLLALPEAPPSEASRLLIVHHEGITAALLTDQVEDIAALPREAMSPPPASAAGEPPAFLQGVVHEGTQATRLLDLPRLLEAVRHGR